MKFDQVTPCPIYIFKHWPFSFLYIYIVIHRKLITWIVSFINFISYLTTAIFGVLFLKRRILTKELTNCWIKWVCFCNPKRISFSILFERRMEDLKTGWKKFDRFWWRDRPWPESQKIWLFQTKMKEVWKYFSSLFFFNSSKTVFQTYTDLMLLENAYFKTLNLKFKVVFLVFCVSQLII